MKIFFDKHGSVESNKKDRRRRSFWCLVCTVMKQLKNKNELSNEKSHDRVPPKCRSLSFQMQPKRDCLFTFSVRENQIFEIEHFRVTFIDYAMHAVCDLHKKRFFSFLCVLFDSSLSFPSLSQPQQR